MKQPQWSIAVIILLTATLDFFAAKMIGMSLPPYLFIVMVVLGYFIHAVILIIQTDGKALYKINQIKGKSK